MVVGAHAIADLHRARKSCERAMARLELLESVVPEAGGPNWRRRYTRALHAAAELRRAELAASIREHRWYEAHRRAVRTHRLTFLN